MKTLDGFEFDRSGVSAAQLRVTKAEPIEPTRPAGAQSRVG
jgi:hypothetical protein